MKIALALTLAATLTTTAIAGQAEANDAMGVGLSPCTEFARLYQRAPINELIYYSWAQGFITAANMSRLMQGVDSINVSAMPHDEQKRKLRAYCNAHPLAEYMDAVAELINTMPTNAGSAKADAR